MTPASLFHKFILSMGEKDREALYKHEETTPGLYTAFKAILNEWVDTVKEYETVKVKPGREEIVRFVKVSERNPKERGWYFTRGSVITGECLFYEPYMNTWRGGTDPTIKPTEWLEIIPARPKVDLVKDIDTSINNVGACIELTVFHRATGITIKHTMQALTPYAKVMARLKELVKECEEKYYNAE